MTKTSFVLCSLLLTTLACNDDGRGETSTQAETGNGDGDGDQTGDGDGDQTGDGDGDQTGDGDGDPTGDPEGSYCVHQCSSDADCELDGQDQGYTCVDNVCTYDAPDPCTGNEECVALFSGWQTACTSGGGECDDLGQVCITTDEGGLCATPPSDFIDCATLLMEEIEVPDIDGNLVTVCARTHAECHADGYCFLPCQGTADCPSAAYPICNVSTGVCECGQDADCATLGLPANSVCNAGTCGCGSDQNCVDGALGDVCNEGFCGCSGDMACEGVSNPYDGGMISCVAF
jgi:hypothetical protein